MGLRTVTQHIRRRYFRRSQVGQSIILLALGMVVLLLFVGLVTDISLMFVRYSQLRRAIDAASIAAAGQVRENRDYADVAMTARQYIRLYGMDPNRVLVQTCVTNPTDTVLCPELSGGSPRKLVRVIAQVDSPTTFLRLLGWNFISLEAAAIAETAVLDVALVLDNSESMSDGTLATHYTTEGFSVRSECNSTDGLKWGPCCNDPGNGDINRDSQIIPPPGGLTSVADHDFSDLVCQPFRQVRDAARQFVQRLDFVRGDRVVYVPFNRNAIPTDPLDPSGGSVASYLISDENIAIHTLDTAVGVYIDPGGRFYGQCDGGEALYWNTNGLAWGYPDTSIQAWSYPWVARCTQTNLGGGIQAAISVLTDPDFIRRQAVWVIIVLSDGAANHTPPAVDNSNRQVPDNTYGDAGYCPWYTFCDPAHTVFNEDDRLMGNCTYADPEDPYTANPYYAHSKPYCTDTNYYTRHFCMNPGESYPEIDAPTCDPEYDAVDFAMDMADFAGLVEMRPGVEGNFMAMYSIGFGADGTISEGGEYMMRYIADAGDNGLIDNNWQQDCLDDYVCGNQGSNTPTGSLPYNPYSYTSFGDVGPCETAGYQEDCGQYWYADDRADLERVFAEIASRLFTRLSR